MKVTIKLVGPFRIGRFKEATREYSSATPVRYIIEEFRIPVSLLGAVLINDIHAGFDDHLKDGDTVTFLPFIDGG